MLHLSWQNVLFRKMRTILTILGIASSIGLVILMSVMEKGTEKQFTIALGHMAGQVRVQPASSALSGASVDTTPQGLVLTAETQAAIRAAAAGYMAEASSAVVMQVLIATATPNQPPTMLLSGVEPGHEAAVFGGVTMAEGDLKLANETDAVIGDRAFRELSKAAGRTIAAGDSVTLPGVPGTFTIRGIVKARDAYTDATVAIPITTAQRALKKGDAVSYFIFTYPVEQAEAAAEALKAKLPEVDVVTTGAMLGAINKAMTAQRQFFTMIRTVVYATAVAIIFMVMWTAVMERTREIGTMRALGARRYKVVAGILTEAAIFTIVGTLVAMTAGWLYMQTWKDHPDFVTPLEYLTVSGRSLLAALVVAAASSLVPSVKAARVNPLDALRYE